MVRAYITTSSSPVREEEPVDGMKTVLEDARGLTSRELLKQSVEDLVSDINAKRKRDAAMLEGSSGLPPLSDHVTQRGLYR